MTKRNGKTGQNNRAVGYVRRSTNRQEQSIDDQKKALETYAIEHGLRLAATRYTESQFETETIAESGQNRERGAQGCKYLFCKRLD